MSQSTAAVPQRSDSEPSKSTYDIAQTIRMSREEWRNQRLHEMADAFMDAFEVTA